MSTGDEADIVAEFEQRDRDAALSRMQAVPQEPPDEDAEGNRYCLDCAEIIPPKRVEAVNAVRCVYCAQLRERSRKISGRGTSAGI